MLTRLVPQTKEAWAASVRLASYSANIATKILAEDGIKATGDSFAETYSAVSKYLVQQGVAEKGTVALATGDTMVS